MKLFASIHKTAPVSLVILLIGLIAAGTVYAVTVQVAEKRITIFSENVIVDSRLVVRSNGIGNAGNNIAAAGTTAGTAVEMANPSGVANTDILKDDYTYTVQIDEASTGAMPVSSTAFSIELYRDGVLLNTLYMAQATADNNKIEGTTAVFGLGRTVPPPGLYVIRIVDSGSSAPPPPSGTTRTFNMDGNAGVGWIPTTATPGNADGSAYIAVANDRGGTAPAIKMKAGETMVLVGRQMDGSPHNLALCTQATATTTNRCTTGLLAGPSPTTAADGQTTTLTYAIPSTVPANSYYTYFCQFHNRMTGTVTVVP